jgi:GTPase Era involved in 16S rRNA processing
MKTLKIKKSKKKKEENITCLKIYLCGSGKGKNYLLKNAFVDITNPYLKQKADKEFKTNEFYWILSYDNSSEILTDDKCQKIIDDIKAERNEKRNQNNIQILAQHIIICFGERNIKKLCKYFQDMRYPRIISVTESKCEINIDKRYITNIINETMNEEEVSSSIISTLWELDCYCMGKSNLICKYTPENIFNGLEKDNSLLSLNILLLGKPRVGKSTLVNLISGKLVSLESDSNSSVTKKVLEYYIYRDDDKNGHSAIKLIDTPGLVPGKKETLLEQKKIEDMIKNNKNQKNLEKRIHFILFLLMDNDLSLEGLNVLELVVKESNCPVFFIINQGLEDKIENYLDSLNDFLGEDLVNEDQIIIANLKIGDIEKIYGISEIFQKISKYIKDKKILDENLKSKIDNLLDQFRKIEENNSFLSLEEQDLLKINNLKEKIQFNEKMEEITNICKSNPFFSNIDPKSIVENGSINAETCKKVIISLSNLQGILPKISPKLPLISIFQGYMVKQISDGFGLDKDSIKYGINLLKMEFDKILKQNKNKNDNVINQENDVLNDNKLIECFDTIEKKLIDLLNESNKIIIMKLADFLNQLGNYAKENEIDMTDNFNEKFTDIIEKYCVYFFEKEINESKGLSFMANYYNKLKILLDDIDYYSQKEDWGSYEMIVKNKNWE